MFEGEKVLVAMSLVLLKLNRSKSPSGPLSDTGSSCHLMLTFSESFLRKKEDDIRLFMQELSSQHYNEDEVIADLQTMIHDIGRTRQAIPQVVQLQQLSYLNRDALERGRAAQYYGAGGHGGMYHSHVPSQYDYSPNSSPDDNSTLV